MAAYVLLEPAPSADAGAAYCTGIGELATTVVMAASYSGPDEVDWEGQIDCRSVAGCFRASPLHCASREGRGGGDQRLGKFGFGLRPAERRRRLMQRFGRSAQTGGSCEAAAVRGYKGKNGRHGRGAAKEARRMETWGQQRCGPGQVQGFAGRHWCCMLDGAGSAGQPGWANRVSLPLQQTGATRTIVSNPRLNSSAQLCAYPFTPARQTVRHPATLGPRC